MMAWMAKACIVATLWLPVMELPVVNAAMFAVLFLVAVVLLSSPNMLYIF